MPIAANAIISKADRRKILFESPWDLQISCDDND